MLFLRTASYDSTSHILTVQLAAPSRTSWAQYQYRDVPPDLYKDLCNAKPHAQHVLDEEIAPFHPVRRVGQASWTPPEASHSAEASRAAETRHLVTGR